MYGDPGLDCLLHHVINTFQRFVTSNPQMHFHGLILGQMQVAVGRPFPERVRQYSGGGGDLLDTLPCYL